MIPQKTKDELKIDPRMKRCAVCGTTVQIEWHHALIYAGRQIQEAFAIHGLCMRQHRDTNGSLDPYSRDFCEFLSIQKGLEVLKAKYPKSNWAQRLLYLKIKLDTHEYELRPQ